MSDKTNKPKREKVSKENPNLKVVKDAIEVKPDPKEATNPKIDYGQYGYRTSETVPIPSVLFYEILGMAALVEKENNKVFYEDRKTIEETFSEKNTPVSFLNPLGMKAKALRYQLNQVHISNVDNGIATPLSVLQKEAEEAKKPAVTLEEEPLPTNK